MQLPDLSKVLVQTLVANKVLADPLTRPIGPEVGSLTLQGKSSNGKKNFLWNLFPVLSIIFKTNKTIIIQKGENIFPD